MVCILDNYHHIGRLRNIFEPLLHIFHQLGVCLFWKMAITTMRVRTELDPSNTIEVNATHVSDNYILILTATFGSSYDTIGVFAIFTW